MSEGNFILKDSDEARGRAAQVVAEGGVIAYRTDTFYGLGVDPFNPRALHKIKTLKGREGGKPILVIISDLSGVERMIEERTGLFDSLSDEFWPGALTLVARARSNVPEELTAGTETIGVRLPDDRGVRDLVRACGGALTATSANASGAPPSRSAVEVAQYFPMGIDLIIDGGKAQSDRPSTVLDVSVQPPRLIREGVITREQLKEILKPEGKSLYE